MKRCSKYGAKPTQCDGVRFASKTEAKRYGELQLLERARQIAGLAVHPRYALSVAGAMVGHYTPDFSYREHGREIVEDVKGVRTRDYIFRAKIFRACYPAIELREIGA